MAAGAEVGWCHTQYLRRCCVETSVRVKPGAVDRFRHRISPGELVPHPLRTVRRRIRFRRDAGESFEDPLDVKAAHAGSFSERLEVRHVLSGLNQMARL